MNKYIFVFKSGYVHEEMADDLLSATQSALKSVMETGLASVIVIEPK
jgi:hypothetical protein